MTGLLGLFSFYEKHDSKNFTFYFCRINYLNGGVFHYACVIRIHQRYYRTSITAAVNLQTWPLIRLLLYWAFQPPSMGMAVPVIVLELSEASNRAIWPSVSTLTNSFTACFTSITLFTTSVSLKLCAFA